MTYIAAIYQGGFQGILYGTLHTLVTTRSASSHYRPTTITHSRLHIAEVKHNATIAIYRNQF